MDKIQIKYEDALYIDKDISDAACKIANGIIAKVTNNGWIMGERNDMAVDYTIAIYELGIDYDDARALMHKAIDNYGSCFKEYDYQDFNDRFDTVLNYCEKWECESTHSMHFSYGINPSKYYDSYRDTKWEDKIELID